MAIEDVRVANVFSPYQLIDFQKCPRLWDYKRRWVPRSNNGVTAMLIGTAVALGLEAHYDGRGRDPVKTGEDFAHAHYFEGSDRTEEGVIVLVRRGIKHAMATNLGLREVLAVEKYFGSIKPDMVGRFASGELVVVDHKVKMNLDDRYKENELVGFDTSNQMMHYAWAIGLHFGEIVKQVLIHFIVLAPRVYTEVHVINIDQDRLEQWLTGAVQDWHDMARGENRPRYSSCVGKYGACEFYHGCHALNGAEGKFSVLYDVKPKYWKG